MKPNCPNLKCTQKKHIIKDGTFKRACDSRTIQRFKCRNCEKRFSLATFTLEKNQKKRRENHLVFSLLSSGLSMRRIAKIVHLNEKTVARKALYLAKKQRLKHKKLIESMKKKVVHLQFDDLVTIEHTKLKPVSVSLAVDAQTRVILGAEVSCIPAFGHLAKLSVAKYGRRKNEHKKGLKRLFELIAPTLSKRCLVQSDEHKLYPSFVNLYAEEAEHLRHKGGRGCVAGQGELKKKVHDPIFMINHTCAMLRANINRLIRRTWSTTKNLDRLKDHLDIYMGYHNFEILKVAITPIKGSS